MIADHSVTRIGVVSDTHIPRRASRIPEKALELLKSIDLIIHCGDLVEMRVVDELGKLAPVLAVHGNMDPPEVKKKLPQTRATQLHGFQIGIIHDTGDLWGINRAKKMVVENGWDAILFGHTHRPLLAQEGEVLFLNPGSPTSPLPPFLVKPSVGMMTVSEENIEARIVKL